MNGIDRFNSWVAQRSKQGKLLCHFYYSTNGDSENEDSAQKRYYTKVDYAYFNLLSRAKDWIVKGTMGHGIDSSSIVPVLNCYEVNKEFIKALNEPVDKWAADYELGIILDKKGLTYEYGRSNIADVKPWHYGNPPCALSRTWCFDIFEKRRGVLDPFNWCDVVRLRIKRKKDLGIPLKLIPHYLIPALLVRRGNYHVMRKLLERKRWRDVEVFPLLPE
jgi:hypothetical protein